MAAASYHPGDAVEVEDAGLKALRDLLERATLEVLFYRDEGARIADARKARNWTQNRLADEIGVSRATIANIETGRVNSSAFRMMQISSALDRKGAGP